MQHLLPTARSWGSCQLSGSPRCQHWLPAPQAVPWQHCSACNLPWKCTFVRAPWSGDVELHWNFPVAEHLHVIPSLQHMELEAPDQWYLPRPSPLPYFCSLACICPQGLRLAVHQGRGQRHCEVQLCAGCSATTSVCLLLGKGKQRRRNIDCLRRYQLPGSITRSAKG